MNRDIDKNDQIMLRKIARLNVWSVIFSYTSMINFFQYPLIPQLFWILMGLVGGLVVVWKNILLKDLTRGILAVDIAFLLIGLIMSEFLPNIMGLVKTLIIVVIGGAHGYVAATVLEKKTNWDGSL